MTTPLSPGLHMVSGSSVYSVIADRKLEVTDLVEHAYTLHGAGSTTNPPSHFLRFPDNPTARIIALPAAVRGDSRTNGIKWISGYPDNLRRGIPRASALIILNDPDTGYPIACLEGSIISAARTAASAAVAFRHLRSHIQSHPREEVRVGFFGAGLIARYLFDYLKATGVVFGSVDILDHSAESADGLAEYIRGDIPAGVDVRVPNDPGELVCSSDLVVFATTAASPHVTDPSWFSHNPLVLHISLRDLAPEIILRSTNVVDDVDHVLKAETSVHQAEQRTRSRDFIHATLPEVIAGQFQPSSDRPLIFSPFGLGVLDLVVASYVHNRATEAGLVMELDDFFYDLQRHSHPTQQVAPRDRS
jgi:2,3-diaminopropionate biosynthesis protein SbnB